MGIIYKVAQFFFSLTLAYHVQSVTIKTMNRPLSVIIYTFSTQR